MNQSGRVVGRLLVPFLATVLVAVTPAAAPGQGTGGGDAFAWITELVEGYVDEGRFSGVVAVSLGGVVEYAKGFGQVGPDETNIPPPGSILAVGSISKSFTAAVVLDLIAEGSLTPESSVRDIFPAFPSDFDQVTVRHLLNHTSGLAELVGPDADRASTPADLVSASSVRLSVPPGREFRYSNTGYLLLGLIIEALEDAPLDAVFAERIFDPLGLEHTALGSWRDPARRLQGMRTSGLRFTAAEEPRIAFASSGGGITATAGDLALWGDALNRGRVDDGIESATAAPSDGPSGDPYRNGWYVDADAGEERYYHGGRIQGFDSHLARLPEREVAIAVLSNLNGADLHPIVEGIESALRGERPPAPVHFLSRSALGWLETHSPEAVAERTRDALLAPPEGWRAEVRDLMDVARFLAQDERRPPAAVPFARLAEELFPRDPMTFVFSGDIHRWADDMEGARVAYERALEVRPGFPPALAALRRWFGRR